MEANVSTAGRTKLMEAPCQCDQTGYHLIHEFLLALLRHHEVIRPCPFRSAKAVMRRKSSRTGRFAASTAAVQVNALFAVRPPRPGTDAKDRHDPGSIFPNPHPRIALFGRRSNSAYHR